MKSVKITNLDINGFQPETENAIPTNIDELEGTSALKQDVQTLSGDLGDVKNETERINLEEDQVNQGKLIFTPAVGDPITVQGGFLPDNTSIILTQDNQLQAKGLVTQTGYLSGDVIKEVISAQGGYLDSHDFGTANPTDQELTDYAIQNIGTITQADEIWDKTRVINLYDHHTWIWDLNSETWSDLGEIAQISDANNDGLHGLVTGAPNDGDHDYMGNIDANGQININGLPELANTVSGKQDIIDANNLLSSDLVTTNSDTNTNLFVTANEKIIWSGKQDALVGSGTGQNIKTINNNNILGSGNLEIGGLLTFPNTWTTNTTMLDFFTDIENDSNAVVGKAYLGEVTCSDLPFSGNAELTIQIMNGTGTNKVILATLTSADIAPYYWQRTYSPSHNHGWQTFISNDNNIPEFNINTNYVKGDLVLYQGIFYRAKTNHYGNWNSSHFDQVNLKDLFSNVITLDNITQQIPNEKVLLLYSGANFYFQQQGSPNKVVYFSPSGSSMTAKSTVNKYVSLSGYDGTIKIHNDNATGEYIIGIDEANQSSNNLKLPNKSGTFALLENITADAFSTATTYAIGDLTIYNAKLYKCTTAHTGTWDSNDFTEVTVEDVMAKKEYVDNAIANAITNVLNTPV